MPKMFIKIEDKKNKRTYVLHWSTITDSPISSAVDYEEFVELHYENERSKFGINGRNQWAEQFARDRIQLDKSGVSTDGYTVKDLLSASDDYNTLKKVVEFCNRDYKTYK